MGIELNTDQIYALYDLENWYKTQNNQVFEISGGPGTGKAQPDDTIIPTPKGFTKLKNIRIGDYVYGDDGNPVEVLGVYPQGKKHVYEITFMDGRSTLCCKNHLFTYFNVRTNKEETKELIEIMDCINNGTDIFDYKFDYMFPVCSGINTYNTPNRCLDDIVNDILNDESYDESEAIYLLPTVKLKIISKIMNKINFIKDENYIIIKNIPEYSKIKIRNLLYSSGIINYIDNETGELIIDCKSLSSNKQYTYISKITKKDYKTDMRCIYVNNDSHLYLTNDFIITHNTTLVSYFIDRLGLKLKNILFVAYMGKAASVLQNKGLPAKTIHSAIYDFVETIERDPETNKILLTPSGRPKKCKTFRRKYSLDNKIKLIVLDEASMVDTKIAEDLKSFGVPIVALGDLDQLPPVYGHPYFLKNPDVVLTKIMRQAENNPIIWLASQVREGKPINYGMYGNSAVIRKKDIKEEHFTDSDIVITGTNKLRYNINRFYREELLGIKRLSYPHINEKVICRKNNWNKCVDDVYLTNGISGVVEHIDRESFNGNTMKMNFKADFLSKPFMNVKFDYNHMYEIPGDPNNKITPMSYKYDKMEYAYAITCHSSQGSQYNNVCYLHEDFMSSEDNRKLMYTAITRAVNKVTIVL